MTLPQLFLFFIVPAIFFFLLTLTVLLIGYVKYIRSDSVLLFKDWRNKNFIIKGIDRNPGFTYGDVSLLLLFCIPGIREFIFGWILWDGIKMLLKNHFLTIYFTNRRIKKLNKEIGERIAIGAEPSKEQIALVEKLEQRKQHLLE